VAEYHTQSGKLADPEFRAERARNASQAAHSLSTHVRVIVRNAGKLTPEQLDMIRGLLPEPAQDPQ